MADDYKNAGLELTTSDQTVYTCPADTRALIQMAQIANIHATDEADATIWWEDNSNGDAENPLVENAPIPCESAQQFIDKPLVLEPGDTLHAQASANSALHITLSIFQKDMS